MPLSPSPRPSAHDDGGNFELLRRYTSDARGNLPHGHRGTTFSTTQSHLLYNVADTCVVMPTAGGAPTSNAQNESATFQFKEIVVSHDLRQLQRTNSRGAEIAAIVALASGEVLRWMPLARKPQSYTPCVKEGAADGSGVTLIRWCPGTDGAFITAHANGQLLLYDAQRKAEADGTLGLSSPGGGGPSASPRHGVALTGAPLLAARPLAILPAVTAALLTTLAAVTSSCHCNDALRCMP